jgi:heavy metal sensor kinase
VDLVDARGVHWRAVDAVVSIGPHTAIVRVARSAERLHEDLFELSVVLLGGIPVMLFIAGMAGFGLADRVLRPIDLLARDAERITADRLHERLSSPNPHDEIGRLTAVFNAAFQRIASAFDQLRRFTADASHELRTPLSVVRGIGEATLAQPRTPAEYQDSIGSMLEEVERMTGLVNALLRLTNADAGEIGVRQTVIDLAPIAAAVVASLTILAEEKGQTLQLDGDAVEVTGDALLVREALSNIVDNAIKYSPRGSLTHVRVRREGEWGVVTVDDQGPGIDPRYRDRVFDRFFRIDEARSRETGGSGLGLAIARWAIESSGGQISVEEGRAGGACFRIALPLASTGVAT